jgi:prepilin-type N-terminal cleavage/methylation domain-containing protein
MQILASSNKELGVRHSRGHNKGFTLIEVAISIAILGIALATLVSLQSGYLRNATNNRSLVRAALVGQYILSVIEADDNFPGPGASEKELLPILERLGYFEDYADADRVRRELEGWRLRREITNVGIPPIESALRKIVIEILWGDSQAESFSLTYFIKSPDLPAAGGGSTNGGAEPGDADGGGDTAGEEDQAGE